MGVESTVVSVVGDKPTLFRPGHITLEDLERALGEEVELSKACLLYTSARTPRKQSSWPRAWHGTTTMPFCR